MFELHEATKIIARKKELAKPNKQIHLIKFDDKEKDILPIIEKDDYIGFTTAIVENIVLVYELKPDRDVGCFKYTYQDTTGYTIPCDRAYHIPHDEENTLRRKIYNNIITNSAYKDDEDMAYDILAFWKELRLLKHDYVIFHTPILFLNRNYLVNVLDMIEAATYPFPIEISRPVELHLDGRV